ncbi:MAG: aldo/keto reductase [Eubacteriales bacterium]
MEVREIKALGVKPSLLGFGCMRFPVLDDGKINEVEAERMMDYAIAQGVNYIDTAYPYHDGDSEPFTGKVMNKYPRDSYYLASKMPLWLIETLEDAKRIFENQLERLEKDYIDFYLLHALNKDSFQKVKDLHIISYLEELKKEGKIRFIGFSFHDQYEVFDEILHYYPWDFCQIQLNYMDTDIQAGMKGYEEAAKLNIPVIIMEPVKGGSLVSFAEDINQMFTDVTPDRSIVSWAIRYVASLPNVKVILSGMSTMEQVEDNLKTCTPFIPLSDAEQDAIKEIVQALHARIQNGCTGCRYCMPCPLGVDIPANFRVWNTYHIYNNFRVVGEDWNVNLTDETKAKKCVECGKCEPLCPQQIKIREDLKKVQIDLDRAKEIS